MTTSRYIYKLIEDIMQLMCSKNTKVCRETILNVPQNIYISIVCQLNKEKISAVFNFFSESYDQARRFLK